MCLPWGDVASCSAVPEKEGEGMQCYLQHPPDSTCAPLLRGSRTVMWPRVMGWLWSFLAEMPLPNPGLPLKTCPRAPPWHPGLPAPPAVHPGWDCAACACLGVCVCICIHIYTYIYKKDYIYSLYESFAGSPYVTKDINTSA